MDNENQPNCSNQSFTSQSPNNESIKSFKEFKTLKILNKKTRDITNSSTTTFGNETDDVYDDAYAQLTQNENQPISSNVASLDLASRPKKK